MKKIQVKAVVFDYGNTITFDPLLNILKLKIFELQKILEKVGYKFKGREIINAWYKANEEVNYPHISHFAQEEPIIEEALKKLGVRKNDRSRLSKKLLLAYRKGYEEVYRKDPRKKEVKATLEHLKNKGKKLAVLSNGRKFDTETAMKLHEISEYFEFILSSEEVGVEKPDPLVFKTVIQRIGEKAEDIIYIGDDPVRDVQAAKKSGMKAALYTPPKKYRKSKPWRNYNVKIPKKYQPDAIVKKFSQLAKIII